MFSLGQRFMPTMTEWFLHTTSFQGQRTDRPKEASGPDGMFMPSPTGESRTHDDYDAQAKTFGLYVWLRTRPLLWGAVQFLGVGLLLTALLGMVRAAED